MHKIKGIWRAAADYLDPFLQSDRYVPADESSLLQKNLEIENEANKENLKIETNAYNDALIKEQEYIKNMQNEIGT